MSGGDERRIYDPCEVVFGVDPFKPDETARPWLILSNFEGRPFHGDQYVAVTLTTKLWMDGLVDLSDDDWVDGGTPEPSRIVPWGVQSLGPSDIDFYQGRLRPDPVDTAVARLQSEIER